MIDQRQHGWGESTIALILGYLFVAGLAGWLAYDVHKMTSSVLYAVLSGVGFFIFVVVVGLMAVDVGRLKR